MKKILLAIINWIKGLFQKEKKVQETETVQPAPFEGTPVIKRTFYNEKYSGRRAYTKAPTIKTKTDEKPSPPEI